MAACVQVLLTQPPPPPPSHGTYPQGPPPLPQACIICGPKCGIPPMTPDMMTTVNIFSNLMNIKIKMFCQKTRTN